MQKSILPKFPKLFFILSATLLKWSPSKWCLVSFYSIPQETSPSFLWEILSFSAHFSNQICDANMSKDFDFPQCKNANSGYLEEVTTRKVQVDFYLNITRLISDSRTVIVRHKLTRFSVSNFKHICPQYFRTIWTITRGIVSNECQNIKL